MKAKCKQRSYRYPAEIFIMVVVWLLFIVNIAVPTVHAQGKSSEQKFSKLLKKQSNSSSASRTTVLDNGRIVTQTIINGPPTRPPGYEFEGFGSKSASSDEEGSIEILPVPAYDWFYGCSAVCGAMMAGYYDRTGFPNMYTGPTNGGVMPLDSSSWPEWMDQTGSTYRQNPLVASRQGLDGRADLGSLDDYWVAYLSIFEDPYITGGWTQHTWGDAIGDYMKTSQSAHGNDDGATAFMLPANSFGAPTGSPLTCGEMKCSAGLSETFAEWYEREGTIGIKLFYESRGYFVSECYNQYTDNVISGGFSFEQFKAEIDAGRPVFIGLLGCHNIVGIGYVEHQNTIFINDAWDNLTHTMPWGGSYSGMDMNFVSIVTPSINPSTPDNEPCSWGKPCVIVFLLGDDNPKLENLRDFRDNTLAQSAVGRKMIELYYTNSDSINAALERSPMLKAAARRVLEIIAPMVGRKEE